MKLFPTLIALAVSGFANAQHHLPAAATSNINGGINSPTSSNVDIESVATISDEADDTARKLKLHDVLTSVKDIMENEFGLTTTDGSGRRLSKSHKSDKGIDIIDKVLLLIILLVAEFLGLGGGYDTSMLDGLLGGAGEEEEVHLLTSKNRVDQEQLDGAYYCIGYFAINCVNFLFNLLQLTLITTPPHAHIQQR